MQYQTINHQQDLSFVLLFLWSIFQFTDYQEYGLFLSFSSSSRPGVGTARVEGMDEETSREEGGEESRSSNQGTKYNHARK